jgi:hypothetical protein
VAAGAPVLAYAAACFGVPPSSMFRVGVNVGALHHGFHNSLRYGPLPLFAASARSPDSDCCWGGRGCH